MCECVSVVECVYVKCCVCVCVYVCVGVSVCVCLSTQMSPPKVKPLVTNKYSDDGDDGDDGVPSKRNDLRH